MQLDVKKACSRPSTCLATWTLCVHPYLVCWCRALTICLFARMVCKPRCDAGRSSKWPPRTGFSRYHMKFSLGPGGKLIVHPRRKRLQIPSAVGRWRCRNYHTPPFTNTSEFDLWYRARYLVSTRNLFDRIIQMSTSSIQIVRSVSSPDSSRKRYTAASQGTNFLFWSRQNITSKSNRWTFNIPWEGLVFKQD